MIKRSIYSSFVFPELPTTLAFLGTTSFLVFPLLHFFAIHKFGGKLLLNLLIDYYLIKELMLKCNNARSANIANFV